MHSSKQFSLKDFNTFNVDTICPTIYFPESITDLKELNELGVFKALDFYILGEGSNTLFVEQSAPVIIKPDFQGISVTETREHFIVKVGASENWHDLVCYCIAKGIYGLENLALIPGCVGAAPVQNIGAYGVEFSDFCTQVSFFHFEECDVVTLPAADCLFSYRDSVFKKMLHNQGVITEVTLTFPKIWQAKLTYHGLDTLPKKATAKEVMQQVIQLRKKKLPDPKKLPNAGSFFKNPVLSKEQFNVLQANYLSVPHYPSTNHRVKVAAAWLIEQSGLKGFRYNAVGTHKNQALVLINYAQGSGSELVSLAKYIQQHVLQKFDIKIEPEVRMISALGELPFSQLDNFTCINERTND